MMKGDFYFSTGVELTDIGYNGKTLKVNIKPDHPETRYTVEFIGYGGKILETSYNTESVYRIRGNERYVRARITDSNGFQAWTQPQFTRDR